MDRLPVDIRRRGEIIDERGKRKPGYEILVRLIGALGVDAGELLPDTWIPPEIGEGGRFAPPDPPDPP